MRTKTNFGFLVLLILAALILLWPWPWAHAKGWNWQQLQDRLSLLEDLNSLHLSPEKEAALVSLDQKYKQERQSIDAAMKANQADLQALLAAAQPDQEKLVQLVKAANATQERLVLSFKQERDEALALMTPVQQAQFMVVLNNWYHEMMKRSGMKKS